MTGGLISERRPTGRSRSAGSALARRIVLHRLAQLSSGSLLIREGNASFPLGLPSDDPIVLQVEHPRFYTSVVRRGAMGAAEAWIEGDWTSERLVPLLRMMIRNLERTDRLGGWQAKLRRPAELLGHLLRSNTRRGSRRNIHAHYDLGNDFFECFLDETMTYSAGIFPHAEATLREASETKLDRLIAKLDLRPDHHLLEIGTGWGSMSIRAASTTGCRVTTTTLSREQAQEARARVKNAGLEDRITILETDYRDLEGRYDRVVAVEMIEAVGHRFLPAFFKTCSDRLQPEGRLVLQAIAMPDHRYDRYLRNTDFIREVVFPGSCCPSVAAMNKAASDRTDFQLVDLEDMAPHYAMTLHRWRVKFTEQLDAIRQLGLDEYFIRMWDYYLAYCEAGFAEAYIRSVQMVFDRPGMTALPELASIPELDNNS